MLYELVAIARIRSPAAVHADARLVAANVGKLIINNRGVVREINSMGVKPLPKIMKKLGEFHFQGSHFSMLFDSSAPVQREILKFLKSDPRVIRSSLIKLDDSKNLAKTSSIRTAARALAESGFSS